MSAAALGVVTSVILVLFVATLLIAPELPTLNRARAVARRVLSPRARRPRSAYRAAQHALLATIANEQRQPRQRQGSAIVAAFYAPWQESGLHSLKANADRITHLMPAWLALSTAGDGIDDHDWNPSIAYHNLDVVQIAHDHGIALLPVFSNASETTFDRQRLHTLLSHPDLQTKVIRDLTHWLLTNRMQGVNLDFENIAPADAHLFPPFVRALHQSLARVNLVTSVDIEASLDPSSWTAVAAESDFVVVMAYDQHSTTDAPGPIAGIRWYRSVLSEAQRRIPAQKLVMGIGNYAYDWQEGGEADPMSYQQALIVARDSFGAAAPTAIDFDAAELNPTFNYQDEDGHAHEVWFLDGVTASNQCRLARDAGVRGSAVWALGLEDPSVWTLFDRHKPLQLVDPVQLQTISFPYDVEFVGEGDILRVDATPESGHRDLEIDRATRTVVDEKYTSFPTAYVIRRSGIVPRTLALTIDDGPAEPYTSEMLDALKKYNVKATFFVIGQNLEKYPDLLQRIWREGHEIGSHTYTHPNMGEVSDVRATLELNATQRAIESVIGRSTVLFRPPFNADAEPTTREEVLPIVRAAKLGYITVGEYIDPQDWDTDPRQQNGKTVRRTAGDIAASIISGVHSGHGNCVLLHDGGGNRTASVAALKIVIPQLKAEGYRFATVSELLGTTRDAVMPVTSVRDRVFLGDDRMVFGATSHAARLLEIGFIAAIILALLRVLALSVLALRSLRHEQARTFDPAYRPSVSVLIAAYNEESVVAATIASVLRCSGRIDEVIVVDDGSTDATSRVVAEAAKRDPRIRLLTQPNRGKAVALNNAIRASAGEILVCVDADTHLHVSAIEKLVRHFCDERVGAVAGNVRVGNRGTLVTMMQSLEYTTSQNLDRRAWSAVNAVPVVPGAIGAWRRSAVLDAGGYSSDTVAEDTELTWRLRRIGWRIECENEAISRTEAPETIRGLFRQRFRWAYGTLQCLWKHRDALGRYGWFGRAMLPSLWLFQIAFQLLSPLADIQLIWTMISAAIEMARDGAMSQSTADSLLLVTILFSIFTGVEMIVSAVALRIEREPLRYLPIVALQRFFYRQLMYAAIVKSISTAIQGLATGWGKLDRTATVQPDLADAA